MPSIPVDSGVATSAGKQGQRYAKAVAHKGHGLGPPHLYVFGAVLKEEHKASEEDGTVHAETQWLQEKLATYEAFSLEERSELVTFFRVSKVYRSDQVRLTMSLGHGSLADEFRQKLLPTWREREGWSQKIGRPPAGHLERELGKWLHEFLS